MKRKILNYFRNKKFFLLHYRGNSLGGEGFDKGVEKMSVISANEIFGKENH